VHFEAYILLAYTKRTMNRESERIRRDAPMMGMKQQWRKVLGRKKELLITQWRNVFNQSVKTHKPFGSCSEWERKSQE